MPLHHTRGSEYSRCVILITAVAPIQRAACALGIVAGPEIGTLHGRHRSCRPVPFEHVAVQEQQSTECLILRGSCNVLVDGQMSKKRFDFCVTHIAGMALIVEHDEPLDPIYISMFRAN